MEAVSRALDEIEKRKPAAPGPWPQFLPRQVPVERRRT